MDGDHPSLSRCVGIVASFNEYLSLPKTKKGKKPSDASQPDAIMASSLSSQQPSLSSSSTSHHGHLARQLALKNVKAMIRNDWTKCNDNIRQNSGVCSSWMRRKDPSMTLAAFQSL